MIRYLSLNQLPGGVIDDRVVPSFVQLFFVTDLADVNRIAHDAIMSPAGTESAAADSFLSVGPALANDT